MNSATTLLALGVRSLSTTGFKSEPSKDNNLALTDVKVSSSSVIVNSGTVIVKSSEVGVGIVNEGATLACTSVNLLVMITTSFPTVFSITILTWYDPSAVAERVLSATCPDESGVNVCSIVVSVTVPSAATD